MEGSGGVANEDCSVTSSPYINVCDYDGAFEALKHIYNKTLTVSINYCNSMP